RAEASPSSPTSAVSPSEPRPWGSSPNSGPYGHPGNQVDAFLTWLAVAAGVVGALVVLLFLLAPLWNERPTSSVYKEHEDTSSDQGRDRARDRAPRRALARAFSRPRFRSRRGSQGAGRQHPASLGRGANAPSRAP